MKNKMRKIERFSPNEVEVIRSEDDGGSLVVSGYAAVYDSESKPLDSGGGRQFIERIMPDAFSDAVRNLHTQKIDCVATYQHNRNQPLARTSSGTLTLESDAIGLKFRFEVPDTSLGRDLTVMLNRGDLKQCSFVARALKDDVVIRRGNDGIYRHDVVRFTEIRDISLVLDPAYDATVAFADIERSITELEEAELEVQRALEEETALKESQLKMLNTLITRDEN